MDHGLAAVDPHPDGQCGLKLLAQLSHRLLHGQSTADSSLIVVVVNPWDAEHDHDRVSDALSTVPPCVSATSSMRS